MVLQFPHAFWDDSVDYFGAAGEEAGPQGRGWCFMFWNFHRFSGKPTLAALVSGRALLLGFLLRRFQILLLARC